MWVKTSGRCDFLGESRVRERIAILFPLRVLTFSDKDPDHLTDLALASTSRRWHEFLS
jgi:hypothetical protein